MDKIYNDSASALQAFARDCNREADNFWLSFPPQLDLVPAVRQFVSQVLIHKGYHSRDSFRIEAIVDEICNNAVEYGSSGNDHNITLRMKIDHERVELDAENESDPAKREQLQLYMNDLRRNLPHLGEERRGRGLTLVKLLASEFTAKVTDKGTIVHVTKLKED